MYAEGVGADVDLERAYLWLELASDGGDNVSVDNVRNLVAGQLTEAQREDVLRRVRECRASSYERCAETGEDAVRAGDALQLPVPE
jgi:TPR repeat protein